MSFWNFLGEVTLFNLIRNLFCRKPNVPTRPVINDYNRYERPGRTNSLQSRIDEIEDRLGNLHEDSEEYDMLDDELSYLEDEKDELDDLEFRQMMDDDYDFDEPDNFLDDPDW